MTALTKVDAGSRLTRPCSRDCGPRSIGDSLPLASLLFCRGMTISATIKGRMMAIGTSGICQAISSRLTRDEVDGLMAMRDLMQILKADDAADLHDVPHHPVDHPDLPGPIDEVFADSDCCVTPVLEPAELPEMQPIRKERPVWALTGAKNRDPNVITSLALSAIPAPEPGPMI